METIGKKESAVRTNIMMSEQTTKKHEEQQTNRVRTSVTFIQFLSCFDVILHVSLQYCTLSVCIFVVKSLSVNLPLGTNLQLLYRISRLGLRDINSFMNTFERWIHPKNLFVIIPSGILVYWMMSSYVPSFFKKV